MIEVFWRPVAEHESGVTFLVSPRSGELSHWTRRLRDNALERCRRRERLLYATRTENLPMNDLEQGYVGDPGRRRSRSSALMLRFGWLCAELLARFAPLDRAFRGLERCASHVPAARRSVADVLDAVAHAERSFYSAPRTQRCLARTMLRFFLFRLGRYPVEANIGLWYLRT